MRIKSLYAEKYRNINSAEISFSDGVNLLFGKNGAGKTNVLEALYLFAICKSFRTNKETDFIMHGENCAHISIKYLCDYENDSDNLKKMSLSFSRSEKKKMSCEDVPITKISEFIGRFRAVFFTPDHMSLVKGSPDERRRFADMALSQIKPGYIKCLNEYMKILSQRNALLRAAKTGGYFDEALFSVYSEALAGSAALITKQRAYFSEYLEKSASSFYAAISGRDEKLFIHYLSSEKEDPKDTEKTKKRYLSLYNENIQSEIKYGATKYGPHKDDILFFIGRNKNKDAEFAAISKKENEDDVSEKTDAITEFAARTFASQGQQRSAVLSLKLAEGEIIKDLSGEYPVYLFDDVFSELDDERKKQLLSLFSNKQVIITCCNKNDFDGIQIRKKILAENGKYTEI